MCAIKVVVVGDKIIFSVRGGDSREVAGKVFEGMQFFSARQIIENRGSRIRRENGGAVGGKHRRVQFGFDGTVSVRFGIVNGNTIVAVVRRKQKIAAKQRGCGGRKSVFRVGGSADFVIGKGFI